MLKQIVYTRCRPHRRITDGAISPTEGFGVYSFSKELVGSSDANFIESRLAIQSAAKENTPSGLFNSYEYYHLSDGQDLLIRDVALPLCTVPRKSGAGHRSGNFLRQGLIGHIDGYPYQWFESSNFDAANHDQNYYYDDSQQPTAPFLPLVQNSPYGGKISDLKLSMFISSRRAALEGAVSFLYGEMAKPEADRKVLLIKDSPENVMYWVAAIEHSFPLDWAKDITFATNRSLMGSQIERNLFSGSMGSSSVGEARKPYAMIVGYLPSSPAFPHYPTSPYAILDGSAKNIVASEKRLSDKFVSFLVNAGSARDYFFSSLIANAKLAHFDLRIRSLYDSYCIVSDVLDGRNGVGIEALARALDNLSAYALDGTFTAKAVSKLAAIYPACLEQDRKAGFALFSNIEKFARSAGLNAGLSEIFFAELTKGIAEPSLYGASLPSCVEAMASIGILDAALHRLSPYFRDDRLRALTNKLAGLPSEYLLSILDLFVKTKANGRLPSGDVAQNADDFNFLWRIVFELVPKGKERKAFEIIGSAAANQRIFFHLYPFYLKQNSPYASRFLDSYLAECHLTKEEIIIQLLERKFITVDEAEVRLVAMVGESGSYLPSLRAFDACLAVSSPSENTGLTLLPKFISSMKAEDRGWFCEYLSRARLYPGVKIRVFDMLESSIGWLESIAMPADELSKIVACSRALGRNSKTYAYFQTYKAFSEIGQESDLAAIIRSHGSDRPFLDLNSCADSYGRMAFKVAKTGNPVIYVGFLTYFRYSKADYAVHIFFDEGLKANRFRKESFYLAVGRSLLASPSDPLVTGANFPAIANCLENELILSIGDEKPDKVKKWLEKEKCDKITSDKILSLLGKKAQAAEGNEPRRQSLWDRIFHKRN